MKKYNLSKIMKRAWELVRSIKVTMSAALTVAWAEAKVALKKIKFDGFAKFGKESCADMCGTEYDSDSNYFYFKRWEKGTMKRIYINDYKNRSMGYINLSTGSIENAYNAEAEKEAERFMQSYAF